MSSLSEQENDTEESGTRRSRDPELASIEKIIRIVDDLDEPAARRAVWYLSSRYQDKQLSKGVVP